MHSFSMFPGIDKSTRVYGTSVTFWYYVYESTDLTDHFSEVFVIMTCQRNFLLVKNVKVRDYGNLDSEKFVSDLHQVTWNNDAVVVM